MANGYYPIEGIPLAPGQALPTRQEITAWYNTSDNKYQVSLFMQALTVFKGLDIHEKLSYYQIAGKTSICTSHWSQT